MASLNRLRIVLSGNGVVGPSTSTFYVAGSMAGQTAAFATFYNAIKALLPDDVTVGIPSVGDIVNSETGDTTGAWSDGTASSIVGTASGAFAKGVGVRIVWETGVRARNRIVRGTTFIVPVSTVLFGADGLPNPANAAIIQSAAQTLIGSLENQLTVWSRPRGEAADGGTATVTSARVPLETSWLRSRRT